MASTPPTTRRAFLLRVALASGAFLALATGGTLAARRDAARAGGDDTQVPQAGRAEREIAIPVKAAPATRGDLVVSVTAPGEAEASRRAALLAPLPGAIVRLGVRENDRVAAGQLLMVTDPAEQRMALAEAEAAYRAAQVQYREFLVLNEEIPDSAVRAARASAGRSRSGLEAAELRIQRARYELARTRVVAPFAGRVANVRVAAGQTVRPGDELLSIVALDPIRVEVNALEGAVGQLKPGLRAWTTFPALPGERFLGTIESINPLVSRDTRTAKVTVRLPNPGGRVLPGMYARVAVEAQRYPGRLLVPAGAVLERDRRKLVFVFEGSGKTGRARWRYVSTGLANDSMVEIVAGEDGDSVRPGELVLTSGHEALADNAYVALAEAP